ncbi:hypothetical protein E1B28_002051 [Marasmius oreades]|uniref:F-box domain-containing protein n=1 Tax=Marasmius oreades TaxID=181124 RepID=A0A9P7V4V8_9AGAR|nr:uncharacterized protein E1B28_002051 [Marasmius oreades]KAG7100278.1 hypothetical protein E1B28_002051 [Marasmius oreades]
MDLLCCHRRRRHRPHLTTLPNELLNEIAFYVACDTLVGLPVSLLPLLLTCKRVYDALREDQAIWRRIFQFKFSWSSVERREGAGSYGRKRRPIDNEDYRFQLQLNVRTLKDIRTRVGSLRSALSSSPARGLENGSRSDDGNEEQAIADPISDPSHVEFDESQSVEEIMWVLWVMCLQDDGCNRVQMDGVGVYEWVEFFVRRKLYDGAIEGWPRDNAVNSCALHVLWYLTTKERLFSESDHDRESLVRIILPFVTIPFRYSSSFAPPNHFHLPPGNVHCRTTSIPAAHEPYPLYLSPDQRVWKHVFYNRRVPLTIPLITDAAKLLYAARRELWRIPLMPEFARTRTEYNLRTPVQGGGWRPAQPTQEDFEELNESLLGGGALHRVAPGSGSGTGQNSCGRLGAKGRGGGTALTSLPNVIYSPHISISDIGYSARHVKHIIQVDESGCASRRWDKDWWRLRKCLNCFEDGSSFLFDDADDDGEWSDDTCVDSHGDVDIDVDHAQENLHSEGGMDVREIPSPLGKAQVYTPGEMTGLWVGKIFIPSQPQFESLIHASLFQPGRSPRLPDNFSENTFGFLASLPVYMRLREHRRISTTTHRSAPVPGGSMLNAWLPDSMEYNEDKGNGKVELSFSGARRAFYETLRRGAENVDDGWEGDEHDGDIIITGETDPRHGEAWQHYRFYGRIRKWDGCVAIMRVPVEDTQTESSQKGRILFYGTLVGGGKNFVGNWRVTDADESSPAYEGAFSLGKHEE